MLKKSIRPPTKVVPNMKRKKERKGVKKRKKKV
jgi:hypothetical protein